ncbi:aminomethyl-transferring glycine dehydrogenase subunit GcvPA [bacterium]|nr:aminomethyl-transferring glycine dehydrogenase subunit GcvPA [bacterium]
MDYLPNTPADREEMLRKIGFGSIRELIDSAIPRELQLKGKLNLPEPLCEYEGLKLGSRLAGFNCPSSQIISFLGAGSYDHFIPAAVSVITSRPEFYTAYTPYQAEVSQGTLQAIFEFQSLVAQLTNMDVANASMYDGGSAIAEAAIFALNQTNRSKILYGEGLNPLYLDVLTTYTAPTGATLIPVKAVNGRVSKDELEKLLGQDIACFIIQNPSFCGVIQDGFQYGDIVHQAGAIYIVAADPTSLGVLAPPGDYNADIVVGEAQSLGNPLYFGGPYLGFYAAQGKYTRKLPGRLSGITADVEGKRGFVLTLQTREQHIRREKATSNICTNQALCALAATVYLSLLGETGFRDMARQCFDKAHYLSSELLNIPSINMLFQAPFFKEFAITLPENQDIDKLYQKMLGKGFIPGLPLGKYLHQYPNGLLLAVTEKRTKKEMDEFIKALHEAIQ